jgi:hypothetical protein
MNSPGNLNSTPLTPLKQGGMSTDATFLSDTRYPVNDNRYPW